MNTATDRFDSLVRLRYELDRLAIYVTAAAFTLIASAVFTDGADLPGGELVLIAYPAILMAIDATRPFSVIRADLRAAAAWSALLLLAFWTVPTMLRFPLIAAGAPFVIGIAFVVARFPATAIALTVAITATLGSIEAFIGWPSSLTIDVLLAALMIVCLARIVVGRPPYGFSVWPAILVCTAYIGITLFDLLTAQDFGVAWLGFHTTVWYMLAFIVIAYAGWSRATSRRIVIALVTITALVSAYAAFRWIVGPSGSEAALARIRSAAINVDPTDNHLKTVGSFLTAHQLAFWTGFMAPFCVGVALWARGRWRLFTVGAVGLAVMAMVASEARGPLVGFVAGTAVVLALYQASRAFPGFKAGVVALIVVGVGLASAGALAVSASDPEDLARYTRILTPNKESTFVARELKWSALMPEIDKEPLGHGLGTGGAGSTSSRYFEPSVINIDNSYLKIAYEQGMAVMILFIVGMASLLATLVVATIRARSREAAAIGIGACGTMVSMLVSFYSGLYIEATPVLTAWIVIGVGLSYFVAREQGPEQEPVFGDREARQLAPKVPAPSG